SAATGALAANGRCCRAALPGIPTFIHVTVDNRPRYPNGRKWMELDDVMATECALPSLPRAVALLTTELAQPEPSLRRINHLFLTDPALAARLLREANSHSHPLSGKVGSIPEAIVMLGTAQLRSFV